jgi:hypothetical protein
MRTILFVLAIAGCAQDKATCTVDLAVNEYRANGACLAGAIAMSSRTDQPQISVDMSFPDAKQIRTAFFVLYGTAPVGPTTIRSNDLGVIVDGWVTEPGDYNPPTWRVSAGHVAALPAGAVDMTITSATVASTTVTPTTTELDYDVHGVVDVTFEPEANSHASGTLSIHAAF